jgi:hypothetical protein
MQSRGSAEGGKFILIARPAERGADGVFKAGDCRLKTQR